MIRLRRTHLILLLIEVSQLMNSRMAWRILYFFIARKADVDLGFIFNIKAISLLFTLLSLIILQLRILLHVRRHSFGSDRKRSPPNVLEFWLVSYCKSIDYTFFHPTVSSNCLFLVATEDGVNLFDLI